MTRDTLALIMCFIVADSYGPNAVPLLELLQDAATLDTTGPPRAGNADAAPDYFRLPVQPLVGELLLKFLEKPAMDHRSNPRMLEQARWSMV